MLEMLARSLEVVMRRFVPILAVLCLVLSGVAYAQQEPKPEEPQGDADLSLILEGPGSLVTGEAATYQLTLINDGPDDATETSASLSLPQGLRSGDVTSTDPEAQCSWNGYGYAYPAEGDAASYDGGYATCYFGTLTAGEQRSVTVTVTRTRAYELYISAWSGSYVPDSNYEDNYAEIVLEKDASAPTDLAVSLQGPKHPAMGEGFDLNLQVSNLGPSTARSVDASLYLPQGTEFVAAPAGCLYTAEQLPPPRADEPVEPAPDGGGSGGSTGGSTEPDAGAPDVSPPYFWAPEMVTCSLDQLDVDESAVFPITLKRTSGWELWASAYVGSYNLDELWDNDYASWSAPSDPSVTSDLEMRAQGPATTPLVGETFEMTYEVTNNGPAGAGDVAIYDYVPYGLTFVSSEDCVFEDHGIKEPQPEADAPPAMGGAEAAPVYYGGGSMRCDIGFLEAGASSSSTVTFERTSAYELYDYASVWTSNYDPVYDNNYTDTRFEADRTNSADVMVSISQPEDVEPGESFSFTIDVTNLGTKPATDVQVYDYIADGIELEAVSDDESCSYQGGEETAPGATPDQSSPTYSSPRELVCLFGELQPSETRSVTVDAVRTTSWTVWNSVWVWSSSFDPDYNNDQAYFVLEGDDPYWDCSAEETSGSGDTVTTDVCPVATGGGPDTVGVEAGSSPDDRDVDTGTGADDVSIDIRTGSETRRTFTVRSGRGRDSINVTVAPGAGDAKVVIYGGKGADRVDLDIAPQARNVVVILRLGDGRDTLRTVRYQFGVSSAVIRAWGGAGPDVLFGGQGPDALYGRAGDDVLDAGAGDDLLHGDAGKDICVGGPGADRSDSC